MFSPADISVIIPAYNAERTIRACLDALLRQTRPPFEIIVVDSSQDATARIIPQEYPQVRLVHLPQQTYPGPARNLGVRLACRPIIAFTDADCAVEPGWLEGIAQRHHQGWRAVGGSIRVGDPGSAIAWAGHMMEFREFLPTGAPRRVAHIPSCNIAYRREDLLATGGFPEAYYPQEDLLFNHMLTRRGVEILFDPQISVRHFCRDTLRGYLSHQHRIGRVTCCVLRMLPGRHAWLARHTYRALLAAPLLGILKSTRTMAIFLRHFLPLALHRPAITPLILMGAVWWARGFQAGALTGLNGVRESQIADEPIFQATTGAGHD
jgi:glycosyltransferase involved in cell wall biosynthesis